LFHPDVNYNVFMLTTHSPHHGQFILTSVSAAYASSLIHVKVKMTLCITKHHTMDTYWGSGGIDSSMHSLTLAQDGGEWSTLCPSRFTPRERAPSTYCIHITTAK